MFTTVAFSASMALTVAPLNIPAIADQHVTTNAIGVIVPKQNILLGGCAILGAAILANYARFKSPSLRLITPECITPINTGLFAPDPVLDSVDPDQGRQLIVGEELDAEAGGAIVAIAQKTIICWLADALITPVSGQIIQARAIITVAQDVNVWTFGTLAFVDNLPVGAYSIVGFDAIMPGAIACRIVGTGWTVRPGFIPRQLPTTGKQYDYFRRGRMGVWGSFIQDQVPGVEVLGSVAAVSATYEATVDLLVGK